MSKDFFDKPFNEDTVIKLEMYGDYIRKWAPVFLANQKPFVHVINIFDFFSGVGRDSKGTEGSPLLAINILMEYAEYLSKKELSINLYLNDYNKSYCERLKQNIDELKFDKENINILISNKDFKDAYRELRPKMKNAANLIFLDQFGVKFVNKEFFQELITIPFTDTLFFVSSATYKRFSKDENISEIIGIDPKVVAKTPASHIHKLVTDVYDSFIADDVSYGIAPFSIKKGANIYGLIFGSGHPLGMEKFLEVCWAKDNDTGEANFDIEGDALKKSAPSLFEEFNPPTKIELFQSELEEKILTKEVTSDFEIYFFMINKGFLGQHVRPVIQKLKTEEKIHIVYPSFKCSTVLNKKRKPQKISIL